MTISKYKSNINVVYSCKYHVVWCPKRTQGNHRGSLLFKKKRIHPLIEVDPQYGIHKEIKGKNSTILRQHFPRLPTLWTHSYFVSTVGGAPLSVIKQYVENQKAV